MFNRSLWNSRWLYPLAEELPLITSRDRLKLLPAQTVLGFGVVARDALGRLASRCQTTRLVIEHLIPRLPRLPIPIPDPWGPLRELDPDPAPFFNPENVLDAVLGGVMLTIAAEFPNRNLEDKLRFDEAIDQVISTGVTLGAEAIKQSLQDSCQFMTDKSPSEPVLR